MTARPNSFRAGTRTTGRLRADWSGVARSNAHCSSGVAHELETTFRAYLDLCARRPEYRVCGHGRRLGGAPVRMGAEPQRTGAMGAGGCRRVAGRLRGIRAQDRVGAAAAKTYRSATQGTMTMWTAIQILIDIVFALGLILLAAAHISGRTTSAELDVLREVVEHDLEDSRRD